MVFYGVTAGEEHDNLLLEVFFKESEKKEEAAVRRAYDVALRKSRDRTCRLFLIHIDTKRARAEGYTSQILDFGRLCCGEKHRLPSLWKKLKGGSKRTGDYVPFGRMAIIFFISSSKPTSNIRSASSTTRAFK